MFFALRVLTVVLPLVVGVLRILHGPSLGSGRMVSVVSVSNVMVTVSVAVVPFPPTLLFACRGGFGWVFRVLGLALTWCCHLLGLLVGLLVVVLPSVLVAPCPWHVSILFVFVVVVRVTFVVMVQLAVLGVLVLAPVQGLLGILGALGPLMMMSRLVELTLLRAVMMPLVELRIPLKMMSLLFLVRFLALNLKAILMALEGVLGLKGACVAILPLLPLRNGLLAFPLTSAFMVTQALLGMRFPQVIALMIPVPLVLTIRLLLVVLVVRAFILMVMRMARFLLERLVRDVILVLLP